MTKLFQKRYIIMIAIAVVMILINIVARLSASFSDFYLDHIFPIISTPFAFLTGLFPFSVGELFIILCVVFVIVTVPTLLILLFIKSKRGLLKKLSKLAADIVLWILVFLMTTLTLNCFVMYQVTPFSEKYFTPVEHDEELLIETIGMVADRIIELHDTFERDSDGYIILDSAYTDDCIASLKKIGAEYPQLRGYYPPTKLITNSFFMSQQGVIGVFYPMTMEANYNEDIQPISKPATICHELAHLKGIIHEDEANFVSMVACFNSDNPVVRYSGYLDALYYLYTDAKKLKGTEYEHDLAVAINDIPSDVWTHDISSFTADYWEKNKEKEVIPTETVEAVSDAVSDATLKFNEVEDGILSYYRVVELLMDYVGNGNII